MPTRLCFVCLGNICRSPTAAVVMQRMVDDAGLGAEITVDSAGTGPWHVGEGANPDALRAMTRAGHDGSAHVARQFGATDFARYDLVIGLDASNVRTLRAMAPGRSADRVRLLRDYDPDSPPGSDVPDPWGGPDVGFDDVVEQVTAACAGLLESLRADVSRESV